jgi:hypothetical protein
MPARCVGIVGTSAIAASFSDVLRDDFRIQSIASITFVTPHGQRVLLSSSGPGAIGEMRTIALQQLRQV